MLDLKLVGVAFLYILAIIGIFIASYRSDFYAFLLVAFVGILIIFDNLLKSSKCKEGTLDISRTQCILGKTKLYGGLLFGGCLDIYHILHILLWVIVGELSPNRYMLVLTISILWEVFENYGFAFLCNKHKKVNARFEDVFLNLGGYYGGSLLANLSVR